MKSRGYVIAFEPQGSCKHIGWNRHVQDPTKLPRTKPSLPNLSGPL